MFLHVVVGEMVPKNLALAGPERSALLFAPPLVLFVRGLRPVIAALNAVANATLRLARVEPKDEVTSTFTRDEVAGLVRESRREGLLDEDSYELVAGALRFDERDVRSVLPPLDSLVTVPTDVTPDEVERIAARTGYSRFPVRGRPGGDGELSGYLHLKDALVETDALARRRPIPPEWIRALPTVGADDKLRAAAATMQRGGAHLVLAREADGTIAGIATLEDVLEALVGENPRRGPAAPAASGAERPEAAPGVADGASARTVVLVRGAADDLGAGLRRPVEELVRLVRDVDGVLRPRAAGRTGRRRPAGRQQTCPAFFARALEPRLLAGERVHRRAGRPLRGRAARRDDHVGKNSSWRADRSPRCGGPVHRRRRQK